MKCWWCIPLFILLLLSATPVFADGPYCETARLTSTTSDFGRSVDICGDLAIVGAASKDSIAYIYRREAGGEWVLESTLAIDESPYSWDRFGNPVGISGDTAVVGSPNLGFGSGGCYVYRRIAPGNWQLEQKIAPSVPYVGHIGISAAIDGDRIIFGSRPNPDSCVLIYERDGTTWIESARFIDDGNYYYYSSFGGAVDIDGETAVVGEPWFGHSYYSDPYGAGWIFRHSGGSWNLSGSVTGAPGSSPWGFAYNVAVDDSQIVFGLDLGTLPGQPADSGYIYFENELTSDYLTPENSSSNQHFGRQVAISGDRLLASSTDGIHFFDRDVTGNSWIEGGILPFSNSYYGDLAIDGDTVICGDMAADEVIIYGFDSGYCLKLDASIFCGPPLGSAPTSWNFSVSIFNLSQTFHRRISQQIDVIIGNGRFFSNWRRSWDNYQPGSRRDFAWTANVPELSTLIGDNRFTLKVADTTPPPYNQPPFPPAGETTSTSCTLTLIERTVGAVSLTCTPVAGTLPIDVQGTLEVANRSDYHRRVSFKIVRTGASGSDIGTVGQGWVNIEPHGAYSDVWSDTIPDSSPYYGVNTYSLHVQDVTPSPWNHPPYPPAVSVHSLEDACTVTGYAE